MRWNSRTKLAPAGPGASFDWQKALEQGPVAVSAPCRVDMGGTLDIRTFSYPLQHLGPCTVNIALGLRTTVRLLPHARGRVKVSSRGFKSADFSAGRAPFRHPLGLMFATAAFFNAAGVHIRVESDSPPRSALGGSSVAAVGLVRAFMEIRRRARLTAAVDGRSVALLAHALEESVAGVPCGYQDQLAAAFGGVNAWHWRTLPRAQVFRREVLIPRSGWRPTRAFPTNRATSTLGGCASSSEVASGASGPRSSIAPGISLKPSAAGISTGRRRP
jgi:D-glycero-alpha-D-manno-heptose-7-phosphate kinase